MNVYRENGQYEDDHQASQSFNEDLNLSQDSVDPPPPNYSPDNGRDEGSKGEYSHQDDNGDEDHHLGEESFLENDFDDDYEAERWQEGDEEDSRADRLRALGVEGEEDEGDDDLGEEDTDEWDNDDDPGYVQIMISEQEFFELEEVRVCLCGVVNYVKCAGGMVQRVGVEDSVVI